MYQSSGVVLAEKPSIGIEPTRLYDSSRFKNHGVHSNITMVQLPNGLWVRNFNGLTSAIDISSSIKHLDGTSSGSVVFWMRFETGSTQAYLFSLRNSGSATGGRIALEINTSDQLGVFSRTSGSVTLASLSASTTLIVGKWYFVVFTVEDSAEAHKIYLNGVKETLTGVNTNYGWFDNIGTHDELYFGQYGGDGVVHDGDIALPGILDFPLSLGQTQNIFEKENRDWFGV